MAELLTEMKRIETHWLKLIIYLQDVRHLASNEFDVEVVSEGDFSEAERLNYCNYFSDEDSGQ